MNGLDSPQGRMLELTFVSLVLHRAIYAAAKLGIADLIAEAARTSDELADAVNADRDATYRLLRALASAGILEEHEGRSFSLTDLGTTLRSDIPGSMLGWVVFSGSPFYLAAWQEVVATIETGRSAFPAVHGAPFFDYLADHPEATAIFDAAMTSLSGWEAKAVVDAYDFGRTRTLVDVAGGQGLLLARILEANPELRGVLFDQPQTVPAAQAYLTAAALTERCDVVAGDFFESVPSGADTYLLKYIVHDWDDESAIRILTNCRVAMADGGRVLLIETVVPGPEQPDYAKLGDLEMLVLLGSRERAVAEYDALLGHAGLARTRIVPTSEHLKIIEAVAAA